MNKLTTAAGCAALLALAAPAEAGFARIDFKYTSLAHLGFAGSVISSPLPPNAAVNLLADFLRAGGATVTGIDHTRTKFFQTDADRACERWTLSLYRQEWQAFDQNKVSIYKKIDRKAPAECELPKHSWMQYGYSVEHIGEADGDGFLISAVVNRDINITNHYMAPSFMTAFGGGVATNIWGNLPATATSTIPFASQYVVAVWRTKTDTTTHIVAIGIPESGSVRAGPGAWVGAGLRAVSDGGLEAVGVKSILAYVAQKGLSEPAEDATNVATAAPSH